MFFVLSYGIISLQFYGNHLRFRLLLLSESMKSFLLGLLWSCRCLDWFLDHLLNLLGLQHNLIHLLRIVLEGFHHDRSKIDFKWAWLRWTSLYRWWMILNLGTQQTLQDQTLTFQHRRQLLLLLSALQLALLNYVFEYSLIFKQHSLCTTICCTIRIEGLLTPKSHGTCALLLIGRLLSTLVIRGRLLVVT